MPCWRTALIDELRPWAAGDAFWEAYFERVCSDESGHYAVHLAVLVEPYLQYILDGKKTVESRFSSRRSTPYRRVRRGDIILLKRAAGPVVGLCQVSEVWFYRLEPKSWQDIRDCFTQ